MHLTAAPHLTKTKISNVIIIKDVSLMGEKHTIVFFNWVEMKFYQRGQETSFNGMPSLGLRTNSALALGGPCLAMS